MNRHDSHLTYVLLPLLIIAGFLGNLCAARLFTGFSYLFGSIPVLVVVRLFGIRWGLLAGLAASAWTIELFGHPYAMVWLTLEPVAVGWLLGTKSNRTRNLIAYDMLYWSCAGTPLIWIFFQYIMGVTVLGTLAAMLMYWVIGAANALVASILLTHIPWFADRNIDRPATIPIRDLIFNLTMVVVLLPAIMTMVLHGRNTERRYQHELYEHLNGSARRAIYEIRIRLERHALSAPRADQQATGQLPPGTPFRDLLRDAQTTSHINLTLLDGSGQILATTQEPPPSGVYTACPDGTLELVSTTGVQRCTPRSSTPLPLWQKAQRSSFLRRQPLAIDSLWTIVAEGPFAPYQQKLLKDQVQSLVMLVALIIVTLGISSFTSRRLAQPLQWLSRLTTDLPERLTKETITTWPASSIYEIDQLIGNVKVMARALSNRFQEMTYLTETLELRVAERTRALSMANSELQKEITERKATERQRDHLMDELVTQVGFLQTLIDAIPNPVFYKDIQGRYQGCNRAFEEQLGLTREQIIGKKACDLFPAERAAIFEEADQALFKRRGVQVYETQIRYADSSLHYVILSKATYDTAGGTPGGLIGTVIDISERKRAETERDRLMVELTQKNKELEGIIYVASHDLRSPLVNVQGFSRKLAKNCAELGRISDDSAIPEEVRRPMRALVREDIPRSLGFITSSIEKMDGLLGGLLRLSRLGRASLCFATVDMNTLMADVVASLTWQIEKTGARIKVNDLPPCHTDAIQVSQVFSNLIDNAIKYRSLERPLVVTVSCDVFPEGRRYCVEDNGIGIAPDQQEKVWEIFQRLNPSDNPGEGLGLTLVRRIVDRLGGSVWLESEPGSGSRFYVVLPAPPA